MPTCDPSAPLLQMRGIDKRFPGVHALAGVDVELHAGEVLGLVGENGAGKSTLIKVLAGAHLPDAGSIHLEGKEVWLGSPAAARRAGIAVLYQEFNLVPTLTARENIFLGREASRGWVWRRHERRLARRQLERLNLRIDPDTPCRELTAAQQQLVEMAKALAVDARILVMDEPTAALTVQEAERLFAVLRDLKSQGIGIVYVSHHLDEIFALADRVTVLRDGRHVATLPVAELHRDLLIEMMVGRQLDSEFPRRQVVRGEERLVVRGLCRGRRVRDVSFCIRRGEVLGLTGLVGAGRSETARLLFGADRPDRGEIAVDGRILHLRHPRDAIGHGICLLTEDRQGQGLVLGHSVGDNFALPNLGRFSRGGFVNGRQVRRALDRYVQRLRIRLASPDQAAGTLSGGNQQKVVLAKWLEADSRVLIFDEPTRGIDVGARYEIYQLINDLAAEGKAVLLISSEFPEVLGMADRILVMHEGRIAGCLDNAAAATPEDILRLAVR